MPWRRLRMISSRCCSQRQAVDLDHVVEHAREDAHDLAVLVPVEARLVRERVAHEAGQVDRAEQARAVRRQRLLAARVGGADRLAPPVVVHLVDAVDQHEAGLGEVVRGGHDHVPHALGRQRSCRPCRAPGLRRCGRSWTASGHSRQTYLLRSVGVLAGDLGFAHREGELPVLVLAHGPHELVGDQQRQVELAQPAGLALGADELHRVRMADVERAHLRAAAAAGRRHGEAHLVVDIHERERARGVGARTRHVRAARTQRREFVADAAAGLQREARLVHLAEDVVHRVADGAGHGAVDRRRGGLVLLRAGVRRDAAGRDRAAAQRPQEALVPGLADLGRLDVGQGPGDTLVGVVHRAVDRRPVLGGQAVFLVPDVERRFLERDAARIT